MGGEGRKYEKFYFCFSFPKYENFFFLNFTKDLFFFFTIFIISFYLLSLSHFLYLTYSKYFFLYEKTQYLFHSGILDKKKKNFFKLLILQLSLSFFLLPFFVFLSSFFLISLPFIYIRLFTSPSSSSSRPSPLPTIRISPFYYFHSPYYYIL